MSEARLPSFDELYAQIERLQQGLTGEILEPGVLRVMSRPGNAHRRAHRGVLAALRGHDRNEGGSGWWIEIEPEVRFGDRLAVPDLVGWRVARVPALPEENPLTIVPDWCCEILSPTTGASSSRSTRSAAWRMCGSSIARRASSRSSRRRTATPRRLPPPSTPIRSRSRRLPSPPSTSRACGRRPMRRSRRGAVPAPHDR